MAKKNEYLNFLIKRIMRASKLVSDNFVVKQKGEKDDLITNLDLKIEKYLIKEINKKYPTFKIVSEEYNTNNQLTDNCFVIDPLDGTINFANHLPLWGIQVACIVNSVVVAAVIYLPKINELYWASEKGSYLNGKPIKANIVPIKNTLYAIDGSNNLPIMTQMRPHSSGRRNLGSVCVSMAFVACGRLHGALFRSDKPWDYLPGLYIAKQAGAVTLDEPGFHCAAMNEEFINILKKANEQ